MTDMETTFNNATRATLIETDKILARWGADRGVLVRIPDARDEFELNNYRYKRGAGRADDYALLCVRNSHAGLNCMNRYYANDRMAEFYPGRG